MIIGWKAWYANLQQTDLLTFTGKERSWDNLPSDGCLGIVLFEDRKKPDNNQYKTLLSAYDYYFKSGEVYGVDVDVRNRNIPEEIKSRYSSPIIIRGIWTTDDLMHRVNDEMNEAQLCL